MAEDLEEISSGGRVRLADETGGFGGGQRIRGDELPQVVRHVLEGPRNRRVGTEVADGGQRIAYEAAVLSSRCCR